jgi:hypothetical protein
LKFVTPPHKEIDPNKKQRKGQLWCPYCGEWRWFRYNVQLANWPYKSYYKRCTGCGISDEDYWVKTINKRWGFGLPPRK